MLVGIVSLQGNIGAGKTTVISILKDGLKEHKGVKMIYVEEPLEYWTTPQFIPESYLSHLKGGGEEGGKEEPISFMYLDMYYKDPKRNSFLFQIHAFTTRLAIINKAIEDAERSVSEPYILVSERDLISDKEVFTMMLLEDGLFPRECVPVYERIWNMMAGPLSDKTKAMVHLTVSPDICVERVKSRNRGEESQISVQYLQRIHEFNLSMVERHRGSINVSSIDWTSNINSHGQMANDLVVRFKTIIDEIIESNNPPNNNNQTHNK